MATVTLKGTPFNLSGKLPAVGAKAPDFRLADGALNDVTLAEFKGKKKVISIVPSLDTPVCATSARKFNQKAAGREGVVVLVVSADLPFAQKRFCEAEGLEGVTPLSMVRSKNFAKDYGVLLTEGPLEGLTARAIVVADENDTIVHTELVPEIAEEPDYDAALASIS